MGCMLEKKFPTARQIIKAGKGLNKPSLDGANVKFCHNIDLDLDISKYW